MSDTFRNEVPDAVLDQWDRQLANAEAIDRANILSKAVRAGLTVSANRLRQLIPMPGYPGDKPGLDPLRSKVRVRVKRYERVTVGVLGYDHKGGQHGHLVDQGHEKVLWGRKTGGFVEGKKYTQQAVDQTQAEMESKITEKIDVYVKQALGG